MSRLSPRRSKPRGFHEPTVQVFGKSSDISARVAEADVSAQVRTRLETALRSVDPKVEINPPTTVGPQVGDELRNSALAALSLTLVLVFFLPVLPASTPGGCLPAPSWRCCMTPY